MTTQARKNYDPQMHTTQHILNRTMVNMFNCGRSFSAHIEKKKSRCDYHFDRDLTEDEKELLVKNVNNVMQQNLNVTDAILPQNEAALKIDLSKLPEDASVTDTVRIVSIGDFDDCACIGQHVHNTKDILGVFRLRSTHFSSGVLRLTWCVK